MLETIDGGGGTRVFYQQPFRVEGRMIETLEKNSRSEVESSSAPFKEHK